MTDTAPAPGNPFIELRDVRHRYGNTIALKDCRLSIRRGEIHGLVGENGSGKSTVVKLLSGIIQPTEGSVVRDGSALRLTSPRAAHAAGIVTVFQETLIAEGGSSLDNVFLGSDGMFRRSSRRSAERRQAAIVLERLGAPAGLLQTPVHALSIAHRQILTIVRALVRPWQLLILDESTSALDIETRDRLFELLVEARVDGRSVLFVSHRMDELDLLIDRATVQRSGVTVAALDKEDASPQRLIALMSGRDPDEELAHEPAAARVRDDSSPSGSSLSCSGARLTAAGDPFDLSARAGEITGIASLEGHGGTLLAELLAGVRRPVEGTVTIDTDGERRDVRGYRNAFAAGIAYVPAKRQEEGLFSPMTVADNMMLATLSRVSTLGVVRSKRFGGTVSEYMEKLAVWPTDATVPISALSGGNAQKVLLARWLASDPRVLVLNDPLRGVDVGTKRQFYSLLRSLADAGMAIVLLSTEIEELLLTSDSIVVCRNDTVAARLEGDDRSYSNVLAAMFGVEVSRVAVDLEVAS